MFTIVVDLVGRCDAEHRIHFVRDANLVKHNTVTLHKSLIPVLKQVTHKVKFVVSYLI